MALYRYPLFSPSENAFCIHFLFDNPTNHTKFASMQQTVAARRRGNECSSPLTSNQGVAEPRLTGQFGGGRNVRKNARSCQSEGQVQQATAFRRSARRDESDLPLASVWWHSNFVYHPERLHGLGSGHRRINCRPLRRLGLRRKHQERRCQFSAGRHHAAGSLQITPPASIGFGNIVDIGESTNSLFLGDLDPGSTAVSYPPPNFTQALGSTTNYSGTLTMTYTIPSNVTGSYFELGVGLNYDGHGYNPFFGTNSYTSVDGQTTAVETIPYTISAGSLSYFDFQIFSNTDYTSAAPFYVDDIQVSVPEPASMSVLGGGLLMLTLRRRRQSASSV